MWRGSANRDQRRIRTAWHWTAGSASFAEELRLIARRAAIGGDQDFVVLALHRAPRNAIRSDHSDARTGRTFRTFFTLRPRRTGRPRWTDRTGIALGAPGVQVGPDRPADPCRRRLGRRATPMSAPQSAPLATRALSYSPHREPPRHRRVEDQTRQFGARRTLAVAERFV